MFRKIYNFLTTNIGIAIALAVGLIGFSFYWFQIKPANVRRECSVVKDKLENQISKEGATGFNSKYNDWIKERCNNNNRQTIKEYKLPDNAIPSGECWRKASDEQYRSCLHSKGL